MAHLFPQREDLTDVPFSELRVYELLEGLPDSFYIFHSVQWVKRGNKWKSTWKENDFLILHKALGGMVLEVKGGEIRCQGSVFHQINSETKETSVLDPSKKKDPLSQAIDGVYHYRNLIDTIACDLDDRFPIEAAVWFSTSQIKLKMPGFPLKYREVAGAVLGDEDFKKGTQAIQDVFDFYGSRNKTNVTDGEFRKIIELIAKDFDLIIAPAARKSELDHAFLKLTNEQTGLLDYLSEQKNATVQGVAGTGKTLIAKEAARRFGLEGRNVLFLCFNKLLYVDLMHRYPYEGVTYYNIHTLISKFRPGADTSNVQMRATELLKIDWDALNFDDVIIDEAQDFDNGEILYFRDLAELRDGHFFVFYDKNQLLSPGEVPEWIRDSECKLLLTKNCRNTRQIALTSYNVIDVELNQKAIMINGEQTSISFVEGQALPKLVRLLTLLTGDTYGYEYSDIVILSMTTEDNSLLCGVNRISGIPILRERSNSAVFFTTSRKFKGLESRVVIVTDIDDNCFIDDAKKRNFYVACSRATQKLILFVNVDESKIQAMADTINSKSRFAARGRIAMKTQSSILEL
jgi:hypothetical protein